jgi:hypothetical protein
VDRRFWQVLTSSSGVVGKTLSIIQHLERLLDFTAGSLIPRRFAGIQTLVIDGTSIIDLPLAREEATQVVESGYVTWISEDDFSEMGDGLELLTRLFQLQRESITREGVAGISSDELL